MRSSPPPARLLAALLALTLAGVGCAAGGSPASASRGANVIELDEIEGSNATNAYDLVRQARPNWLRGRGTPNLRGAPPPLPVVYIRNTRQGSVETLRGIATLTVLELRYVDATSATTRYGNGHSGGVIEVALRRR